jgi:hypothetical protein
MLWFVKGSYRGHAIQRVIRSDGPDKGSMTMGQSGSEFFEVIKRLTQDQLYLTHLLAEGVWPLPPSCSDGSSVNACSPEVGMVQTTEAGLVSRLLGITIVLIAAGAVLTLAAQPSSFWSLPQTAIRFDGLAIRSSTNPMFDFFLGRGWPAYLSGVSLYGAAVWLMVSVLPKRLAMVAEFTVILGLSYCGSNWIIVRWHTGIGGAAIYVAAVSIVLALAVFPSVEDREQDGLRRLCWVMAVTITIDGILTLIGQPCKLLAKSGHGP